MWSGCLCRGPSAGVGSCRRACLAARWSPWERRKGCCGLRWQERQRPQAGTKDSHHLARTSMKHSVGTGRGPSLDEHIAEAPSCPSTGMAIGANRRCITSVGPCYLQIPAEPILNPRTSPAQMTVHPWSTSRRSPSTGAASHKTVDLRVPSKCSRNPPRVRSASLSTSLGAALPNSVTGIHCRLPGHQYRHTCGQDATAVGRRSSGAGN